MMKNQAEADQYQQLCSSSIKLVENIIIQFRMIRMAIGRLLPNVEMIELALPAP